MPIRRNLKELVTAQLKLNLANPGESHSYFENDIIFYKYDHFIQLSFPINESEDIYITNRYEIR